MLKKLLITGAAVTMALTVANPADAGVISVERQGVISVDRQSITPPPLEVKPQGVISVSKTGVRWNLKAKKSATSATTRWDVVSAPLGFLPGFFEVDVQGSTVTGLYLNPVGCPVGRDVFGYIDTNNDGQVEDYVKVGAWQPRSGVYSFRTAGVAQMTSTTRIWWICSGSGTYGAAVKRWAPGTEREGTHRSSLRSTKRSATAEARVLTLKYGDTCVGYVTYRGDTWVSISLDTKCPSYTVEVVLYRSNGSKAFDSGYWRTYPRGASNLRWGGGLGISGGWGQMILRDSNFQQTFTVSRNFVSS